MEFKTTVGKNLSILRKSRGLTQLELAEMFSYSDKAVSKWEKGETLPDMETMYKIAKFYGVSLDYLTKEHKEEDVPGYKNTSLTRGATTLLFICFIWLLAIIVYLWLGASEGQSYYQCFIWPIPASFLAIMFANIKWGNRNYTFYFASFFLWTMILAFYLQFKDYGENEFMGSWMLFILGIPVQVAIGIWCFVKANPFLAIRDDFRKFKEWRKRRKEIRKATRKAKSDSENEGQEKRP